MKLPYQLLYRAPYLIAAIDDITIFTASLPD